MKRIMVIKMKFRNWCRLSELSIVKTLIFNIGYFGLKGLRLPVLVSKNVKLNVLRGSIIINKYSFGIVKIGFNGAGICDSKYQRAIWHVEGKITFEGKCIISSGVKIGCAKDARIVFGDNVTINVNSEIICQNNIKLNNNAMISWDVLIMDSDFHRMGNIGGVNIHLPEKPINIGQNAWIGCRAVILKGVNLPDGSIVAANSTISKSYEENNILINSNGIKRRNIVWYR